MNISTLLGCQTVGSQSKIHAYIYGFLFLFANVVFEEGRGSEIVTWQNQICTSNCVKARPNVQKKPSTFALTRSERGKAQTAHTKTLQPKKKAALCLSWPETETRLTLITGFAHKSSQSAKTWARPRIMITHPFISIISVLWIRLNNSSHCWSRYRASTT